MSATVKILPHYTYEDYCLWEGRWEIIEGIPYAMSPAPSPAIQRIGANIILELGMALKNTGCKKCIVYEFIDVKITEDTVVQPDALIVCQEIKKPFLDFAPALVVEILSISTALKDRNTKFHLYEQFGIPYFIIIDIEKQEIECYSLSKKKEYSTESFDPKSPFILHLNADCSVPVTFANIWE